jgi:hypothetical protein
MVAEKWGWDSAFMMQMFGWKATCAVVLNALLLSLFFRKELTALKVPEPTQADKSVPFSVVVIHFIFLAATVLFAHYPVVFWDCFCFSLDSQKLTNSIRTG